MEACFFDDEHHFYEKQAKGAKGSNLLLTNSGFQTVDPLAKLLSYGSINSPLPRLSQCPALPVNRVPIISFYEKYFRSLKMIQKNIMLAIKG